MPKIHLLSDLHLEMQTYQPSDFIKNEADIIILAGDIHKNYRGLIWARDNFPNQEIIYISGNHEFYNNEYFSLIQLMREKAKELKIYFLEKDEIFLDGVRFLGCTLWTNYTSYEHWTQEVALQELNFRLADHHLITIKDDDAKHKFLTKDALKQNMESTAWLTKKLFDESFDGKTVVITHHGPSLKCEHVIYGENKLCPAFYSSFENLIKQTDFWFYGHTHSNLNTKIGKSCLMSNQRGYPDYIVDRFDENLIIEV